MGGRGGSPGAMEPGGGGEGGQRSNGVAKGGNKNNEVASGGFWVGWKWRPGGQTGSKGGGCGLNEVMR
jgi:hypothetical protein